MLRSYKGLSGQQIQKRIKEGRGQGEGRNYKPWIQTWDISSLGRSHRIFGNRSRRLHHLLSDLELAIFLTLDWQHTVLDIREQFPLRVEGIELLSLVVKPLPEVRRCHMHLMTDGSERCYVFAHYKVRDKNRYVIEVDNSDFLRSVSTIVFSLSADCGVDTINYISVKLERSFIR